MYKYTFWMTKSETDNRVHCRVTEGFGDETLHKFEMLLGRNARFNCSCNSIEPWIHFERMADVYHIELAKMCQLVIEIEYTATLWRKNVDVDYSK